MPTQTAPGIRSGATTAEDPRAAAAELAAALRQPDAALVTVFAGPGHDLPALGDALACELGDTPVVGCTTAGEIDGSGYREGSITGFSLGGPDFQVAVDGTDDLRSFTSEEARQLVDRCERTLALEGGHLSRRSSFGILLIDGLAMLEERVAYVLQSALGDVSLFGGSAGDGLDFRQTFVLRNGAFRSGAAAVALVHTTRPFEVLRTQHFEASDIKMVVTAADAERRIVHEINGLPAGPEYARLIGVPVDALTPAVFARFPLMVKMSGSWYVRAIQKVDSNGSLTSYCAIDEGLVLTVGRGVSMVENLEQMFAGVRQRLGEPALVCGCDCILRRLEAQDRGLEPDLARVFARNQVVGFSTYGEQIGAIHVNQTFTGVAIG